MTLANQLIQQSNKFKVTSSCFYRRDSLVKRIMNTSVKELFPSNIISISTNCPLFAWLAANNETCQRLIQLGFLDSNVFNLRDQNVRGFYLLSYIVQHFFEVNKEMKQLVNQRVAMFGPGIHIGLHIRQGGNHGDFNDSRLFLNDKDIDSFIQCPLIQNISNPVIILISDSKQIKQQLIQNYSSMNIISYNNSAFHTEKAIIHGYVNQMIQSVFLDMLTLAKCDYIIGTWRSTYSLLSAAFQGHLPYFVMKNSKCSLPDLLHYSFVCLIIYYLFQMNQIIIPFIFLWVLLFYSFYHCCFLKRVDDYLYSGCIEYIKMDATKKINKQTEKKSIVSSTLGLAQFGIYPINRKYLLG